MTDITADVVDSVIARVKAIVPSISNRIYFEPPQILTFPFMTFQYSVRELATRSNGADYMFTLSAFAQTVTTSALSQCLTIAKNTYDGLHGHRLSLTDGHAFACRWDGFAQPQSEGDGKTIQYIMRYKILTTN